MQKKVPVSIVNYVEMNEALLTQKSLQTKQLSAWQICIIKLNTSKICIGNFSHETPDHMDSYWNEWILAVKFCSATANMTSPLVGTTLDEELTFF